MANRPTSKHTKNEILAMYDELLKENQQLEAKIQQMQQEQQTVVKKAEVEPKRPSKAVPPSTLDGIIETLSVLRPGFGDAVSELSAKLIAEASKLQELRSDVTQEMLQLEVLHELQASDETLELLIRDYIEKCGTFEEEVREHQTAFEKEMAEKKTSWQRKQAEKSRFIKERDESWQKQDQREAAEYTYDLEHRRKLDIEQYEQEQERLKDQLEHFESVRKKAWSEREERIAAQELEFNTLQKQVEAFPKELDGAVKKARDEAMKAARRQTKVQADLRAKETEGERRVYELNVQSLNDVIEKQASQLGALSTQLEAAAQQAQALAMKAIEGTSSTGSLQAVKEIALEQAKTIQKGK